EQINERTYCFQLSLPDVWLSSSSNARGRLKPSPSASRLSSSLKITGSLRPVKGARVFDVTSPECLVYVDQICGFFVNPLLVLALIYLQN
ncbi:hypothetical protein BaRGS_00040004, partial [Batillaria attramentaria]